MDELKEISYETLRDGNVVIKNKGKPFLLITNRIVRDVVKLNETEDCLEHHIYNRVFADLPTTPSPPPIDTAFMIHSISGDLNGGERTNNYTPKEFCFSCGNPFGPDDFDLCELCEERERGVQDAPSVTGDVEPESKHGRVYVHEAKETDLLDALFVDGVGIEGGEDVSLKTVEDSCVLKVERNGMIVIWIRVHKTGIVTPIDDSTLYRAGIMFYSHLSKKGYKFSLIEV